VCPSQSLLSSASSSYAGCGSVFVVNGLSVADRRRVSNGMLSYCTVWQWSDVGVLASSDGKINSNLFAPVNRMVNFRFD